ncbi:hypothetical protein C0989_009042 [Termitomyces sp. Mn162]|nr:hypothetical protein C0989_009042 [Termitomyces sp. Mn162]KAH0578104.1 hypothetical protein H2248_005534 [Termitomyces sp. 'cryptogamus']
MVFGLFSRKRTSAAQLRTPSPSIVDNHAPEPPSTPSPPPSTPSSAVLRAYIQTIPPQTLHAYTLSRLHPSNTTLDSAMLHHLSTFFASLAPPPELHCVRCHKSFFEIENTDRSCLVAHDDESAEVERVSARAKGTGTLYETLWNCCGKTVEGDGDMGPPDGWCYEGQHTTDTKRARFRADSTMHDDKLVSCERLRCGMSPRSTRKRGRLVADVEGDEDECDEQSLTSSHPSTNTSPQSSNSRKKARTHAHLPKSKPDSAHEASNKMDIDDAPPALTLSSSPNPQSRASKPKSKPKSTATPKPKTSSPLVLAPPFTSRPSSPDHAHAHATNKGKVQVVIMSASPRSRKDSVSASVSPERGRERKGPSAAVAKAKTRGTGMRKGKASVKALGEVVDSSVDAERMSEA